MACGPRDSEPGASMTPTARAAPTMRGSGTKGRTSLLMRCAAEPEAGREEYAGRPEAGASKTRSLSALPRQLATDPDGGWCDTDRPRFSSAMRHRDVCV